MADISRLFDFTPSTLIKSSEVDGELNQLVSTVNNLDDANFAGSSGMYSAYRTITLANAILDDGAASGVSIFTPSGLITNNAQFSSAGVQPIWLDDADFAVSGRTTRLRVRAMCLTNDAAGLAVTATVGLYPITAVDGTADNSNISLGTVVTGSTVAFASPAVDTINQGNSGDFDVPADGAYMFGVNLSGTPAANSQAILSAQLQQHWV
jgi:hypothetical protein